MRGRWGRRRVVVVGTSGGELRVGGDVEGGSAVLWERGRVRQGRGR
jgi:hypothetical protein